MRRTWEVALKLVLGQWLLDRIKRSFFAEASPVPRDERNTLNIDSPPHWITPVQADAVRSRIREAGSKLAVWAILSEDVYETVLGDGFYLHVKGVALNSKDAHELAETAGEQEWVKWHVKEYQLGLKGGQPAFLCSWPKQEEFRIGDFVKILADIAPGRTTSRLYTGYQSYGDGPFIELPLQ